MNNSEVEGDVPRGKKRTRAIANLTEEQLQHKRNVDRKAQRAFRQRTKDSICSLELQIENLQKAADERQVRFQDELSSLRESNTALLQCLERITDLAFATTRSMTQAINNDGMPSVEHSRAKSSAESSPSCQGNSPQVPAADELDVTPGNNTDDTFHPNIVPSDAPRSPTSHLEIETLHERTLSICHDSSAQQRIHDYGPNPHTPYVFSYESSAIHPTLPTSATATGSPSSGISHSGSNQRSATSMDVASLTPSGYHGAPADNNDYHPHIVSVSLGPDRSAIDGTSELYPNAWKNSVFTILPTHVPPTCPLDEILHNFLRARRDMLTQGLPAESVMGSPNPTVKALLDTTMASSVHPICGVMSEVLSTFPHVDQPEKLAFFYLMFKTMRWQISPSKDSYLAMPPWLRPTVTQVTVPHAFWIDNIPWPGVRDMLIEKPEDHTFEMFSQYYSQNVRVNWKFDSRDALSNIENEAVLHSIFEKHISNLKNWTVLPEFQRRFPAMTPAIYSRD
ncbi:hypothetical protein BU24DRAFT_425069 [Aaosphaeria arxii CBS 175.79]|uniref:BZIP domain-containing protein n=1 Tax=Aaosphaeria arxii CBS 175.79 TaxID=1450172 RepID=A0A6A5XLD2_9PLEO|nr:uncharacterized protein BU24DRAFT_425069 [Aaosphaeria arxii CBS 175.79]KAF2014075.1 hypothetical protein BU24DRAFT_425069 [Aaosphaeria arxii CBS 175.79]